MFGQSRLKIGRSTFWLDDDHLVVCSFFLRDHFVMSLQGIRSLIDADPILFVVSPFGPC